jgi:hypothetical protein
VTSTEAPARPGPGQEAASFCAVASFIEDKTTLPRTTRSPGRRRQWRGSAASGQASCAYRSRPGPKLRSQTKVVRRLASEALYFSVGRHRLAHLRSDSNE